MSTLLNTENFKTLGLVIGAITGPMGLFLTWRNNNFKLIFEEAQLFVPKSLEHIAKRESASLNSSFIDLGLELVLHNTRNGKGSIEKPRLEISLPAGDTFILKPITKQDNSERINENTTSHWTERLGRSYYFEGHERIDDELDFTISARAGIEPDFIKSFAMNYRDIEYFILYRNHRGKEIKHKITEVNYSDRY